MEDRRCLGTTVGECRAKRPGLGAEGVAPARDRLVGGELAGNGHVRNCKWRSIDAEKKEVGEGIVF